MFFLQRIVEILDPSPSHDGLIEEPYVFKKKKAKKVRISHETIKDEDIKLFLDSLRSERVNLTTSLLMGRLVGKKLSTNHDSKIF